MQDHISKAAADQNAITVNWVYHFSVDQAQPSTVEGKCVLPGAGVWVLVPESELEMWYLQKSVATESQTSSILLTVSENTELKKTVHASMKLWWRWENGEECWHTPSTLFQWPKTPQACKLQSCESM
jgi:hypothetical protein